MKRIILILLFVCVGSLSFANGLDLTYEIPTDNNQYIINEYKMGPQERANAMVVTRIVVASVATLILVVITIWAVSQPI